MKRTKRPDLIKKRIFAPQAIDNFNVALSCTDWSHRSNTSSHCNDPAELYSQFLNKYCELYDKFFPIKILKKSHKLFPRQEWITTGLIRSCNKKCKLYKRFIKNPTDANKCKYTSYRNKLKKLLKVAEKQFYIKKI